MLRLHCKRQTRFLTHSTRHVANRVPQKQQLQYKQPQQQQQQPNYVHDNSVASNTITAIFDSYQKFNQRLIHFNLELYHKNLLKKSSQTFYKKSKRQYLYIKIS